MRETLYAATVLNDSRISLRTPMTDIEGGCSKWAWFGIRNCGAIAGCVERYQEVLTLVYEED